MACSLSEEQALQFTKRGVDKDARVLFRVYLPAGETCKRGNRLSHVSTISAEQEVLFIPGTKFRIDALNKDAEGTSIKPYSLVLFVKREEDMEQYWLKDTQEVD